jgi:hypothetical protein
VFDREPPKGGFLFHSVHGEYAGRNRRRDGQPGAAEIDAQFEFIELRPVVGQAAESQGQ